MADPSRGEIWLADLRTERGHEQSRQRPVVPAVGVAELALPAKP